MKKLSLLLLLMVFVNNIFSQVQDSRNGRYLPSKGTFRIFIVFAELTGDPNYNMSRAGWTAGQMPDNPNGYIDVGTANYQSVISRYYSEISFDTLKIIGDYHPQLIQIPYSSVTSASQSYDRVFQKLSELCNGQQIQTARGLNFPNDFDLWTLGNVGDKKQNTADNKIDCIMIHWRVNSRIAPLPGSGNFVDVEHYPSNYYTSIGNKTRISSYGRVYADEAKTFWHEIAHGLIGSNNFHSGGANGGEGTYMQNYGGYSILSANNRYMNSYNAWDRYRLGWKHPQHQYAISARNENMQEVNTDLDYIQQTGDSVTYILRDFASTGDAVRVKLPYIRTLRPSAKEQWIWIENHQLLPGKIEYNESKHGANSPMYKIPRGIYFNLQVGNNDFSSLSSTSSRVNYIAPINKFGNFDWTAYTPTTIDGRTISIGETDDAHANPFTGVSLASNHPFDLNGNDIIPYGENYDLGKIKYNGVLLGTEYFANKYETWMGSVFDAYYQGDKISISTNPAPFTWLTYARPDGAGVTPYADPSSFDNRKIYLNGLSVRIVEQMSNGDVKICIRWKDYDIKNNVRWCGDIVLNEKVNLLQGNTILLDQGLTPVRPNKPITFNGNKIFASPTLFTCREGSLLKANSGSTVHLKNSSALVAESGSEIELDDANLIVESGSTLHIKPGATLRIKNSGNIHVKATGCLCIESGASVILQDYNSVIKMGENATYGVNPAYLPSANCSSVITYSGNGSVIDLSLDVYIQDETITSNRYIGGRNIYVGNHVTTSKPYGDVLIDGNAKVIFDAAQRVVLDAGFKCALGSTFKILKQ